MESGCNDLIAILKDFHTIAANERLSYQIADSPLKLRIVHTEGQLDEFCELLFAFKKVAGEESSDDTANESRQP